MVQPAVKSIDALFAREKNECTRLSVVCENDQLYVVRGVCTRVRHDDFKVQELIEHHAQPNKQDVQNLFDALENAQLERWYHHYGEFGKGQYSWYHYDNCRWSLHITYQDGSTSRWEGDGDSPSSIDTVYEACTRAGMPTLHLGYYRSFSDLCASGHDEYEKAFERIEHYHELLTTAAKNCKLQVDEETRAEYQTLVSELLEDLALFLQEYQASPMSETLPPGWGAERTTQELCARSVEQASKPLVFALLASVLKQSDPAEAIEDVIAAGAFQRWFRRLREIPLEQKREQARQEKLAREEQRRKLDAAIEKRIEQGASFTAAEVARETGATTSLANGRVRRFVVQGLVTAIGDDLPRKYRAA